MFNFLTKIPEIIHEAKQMQYLFLGLVRTVWLTNLSAIFVDFVSKGYELSDPVSGRF